MDKYQKYIMRYVNFECCDDNDHKATVKIENDDLIIIQNENYNIVDYNLKIISDNVSKISFFDKSRNELKNQNTILISFNEKITKIRLYFKDNFVDKVGLLVKYISADKKAWDKKVEKETREQYADMMKLCLTKGEPNNRTLFFKPCSTLCKKTIVEWYVISKINDVHINDSEKERVQYLAFTDVITEDRHYSSFPNICIGPVSMNYAYIKHENNIEKNQNFKVKTFTFVNIGFIIKQYDDKDNLLVEVIDGDLIY